MACARVTDAGTLNSYWLARAGPTAAVRNAALLVVGSGPIGALGATIGAGHAGIAPAACTLAWARNRPVESRSHCVELLTVPFTYWPLTRHLMTTRLSARTVSTRPTASEAAVRVVTDPAALTMPTTPPAPVPTPAPVSRARTAPASTPRTAPDAHTASSGPRNRRRAFRNIAGLRWGNRVSPYRRRRG